MSTETLAEITQSIREIRESLREHDKWRTEADRQIIEWKAEAERQRAESDKRRAEAEAESDKRRAEAEAESNKRRAEADKRKAEADREMEEIRRIVKEASTTVGALGNKVGEMVEKLVGEGNLVDQFRELGHDIKYHSRHRRFGERGTAESGEIDLFMEDGDVAILVEVKTTLKMDHVIQHLERMEKYRRFVDADGKNGKRFIG